MSRRSPTARSVRLAVESLEDRRTPATATTAYLATDLISDQPGVAAVTDPTLVNAWGIAASSKAFWVSSNGQDLSEVYGNDGNGGISQPFKVTIPGGAPTGQVFNNTGSTTDFLVTPNTPGTAAAFIFASEAGTVTAWNPTVGVASGATGPSTVAETVFPGSANAVYKGIALGQAGGANFLYLADFHNNKIDVLDNQFQTFDLASHGFGTFTDPNLPAGFAPFNVAAIGGVLYVSYAKQDADAHDDVAGKGNGFIDMYSTSGFLLGRLVSNGDLNSPWAMVQAPAGFGQFANSLLVGNFGDGRIHAYNPTSGAELGTLSESQGHPLVIDGLWGLAFGTGVLPNDTNTLYYAAGPGGESHGVFGKITANAPGTNPVSIQLNGTDLTITGSRDNDNVQIKTTHGNRDIVVKSNGQTLGTFPNNSIVTIHFSGLAGNDTLNVNSHVKAAVIADGGAGDDHLTGGGSSDLLVGGTGSDHLNGQASSDILIGGSTIYNMAQLTQIANVWFGPGTFEQKIAALRSGTNVPGQPAGTTVPMLDSTTVIDDGVRDDFNGGTGRDWFFGMGPDHLPKIGDQGLN